MEPLNPRLLCVLSDQYFLPGLLHNMRYGETLRKWFGADLFGTLARHLLRPKAWIVEQAVQFYEARLDGRPSVGIQLPERHTQSIGELRVWIVIPLLPVKEASLIEEG